MLHCYVKVHIESKLHWQSGIAKYIAIGHGNNQHIRTKICLDLVFLTNQVEQQMHAKLLQKGHQFF